MGPAQAGIIRFPAMLAKEMLSPYLRLAKLELDIARFIARFCLFSTGSRFGEVRRRRQSLFLGLGDCALASRGGCARPPPFFGEVSHCLALIPGESWDSGLGPGLDALAVLRASRRICYAIKGTAFRFEIRADNGRFRKPEVPPYHLCVAGRKSQSGYFFQDPFAVRTRLAFVSLRQACYRLFRAFRSLLIPLGISGGKSRSRNRLLEFEIRVDSRRISSRFFRYC